MANDPKRLAGLEMWMPSEMQLRDQAQNAAAQQAVGRGLEQACYDRQREMMQQASGQGTLYGIKSMSQRLEDAETENVQLEAQLSELTKQYNEVQDRVEDLEEQVEAVVDEAVCACESVTELAHHLFVTDPEVIAYATGRADAALKMPGRTVWFESKETAAIERAYALAQEREMKLLDRGLFGKVPKHPREAAWLDRAYARADSLFPLLRSSR